MTIKLVTIFNKDDPGLYDFRKNVCHENGVDDFFLKNSVSKAKLYDLLQKKCPPESQEEVYKVSQSKWHAQKFHSVECVLVENKIISISACEIIGEAYLRVGMNLYTLKHMRPLVRDIMFSQKGFFYRHLRTAKTLALKGVFMSVYAHTDKLRKHALNLGQNHRSVSSSVHQPFLEKLTNIGTFNIKNVEQTVIVYQETSGMDWSDLVNQLKS